MVLQPKNKQVIKYRTQVSYGFAPLPETTYELSSDGPEDKVRIVSIAGQSKTVKTIKVPTGTYEHWLEILIAMHDQKSLGKTFGSFMDGSLDDLWFVMNGKKVHHPLDGGATRGSEGYLGLCNLAEPIGATQLRGVLLM